MMSFVGGGTRLVAVRSIPWMVKFKVSGPRLVGVVNRATKLLLLTPVPGFKFRFSDPEEALTVRFEKSVKLLITTLRVFVVPTMKTELVAGLRTKLKALVLV